ncbi:hypothetical protein PENCOP_c006G08933 [Penicillium coprophilum]|uniref:Beta-ketoacyl synthase-like N-terminal domain-containing protein n=1 Tax=Penicillium coprophilum TaxID=36646 RepID=A0A1V6UMV1_9EURO|nr:hypothetical protein PENCOP_c006G08933 [Penicillium coprophilum]
MGDVHIGASMPGALSHRSASMPKHHTIPTGPTGRVGRNHTVDGYLLNEDVALFDTEFFSFSGDMASAMDPQVGLLLDTNYETLEDDPFILAPFYRYLYSGK